MANTLLHPAEETAALAPSHGLAMPWMAVLAADAPDLGLIATAVSSPSGQTRTALMELEVAPAGGLYDPPAALIECGVPLAVATWRRNLDAGLMQPGVSRPAGPATGTLPSQESPAAMMAPVVEATQTINTGWQIIVPSLSGSPRLWRYLLPGQNDSIDTSLDTVLLTHGWLGSGVTSAPSSPLGFNAGLAAAAVNLVSASRQVLFLDWGPQALDPKPFGVAPYNAAGRVNAVASWAAGALQSLANPDHKVTMVGFSLGSYVAAQTALQLGSGQNLRLVALEPAAAGLQGGYDLDSSNNSADPVPTLARSAPFGSLAFVVADTNPIIGLAGDNSRAGTAQRSFVVRGFAGNTSPGDAHGAIPALYADLARYLAPDAAVTETLLSGLRTNRYNNSGGTSGTLLHEGVVTLRNNQGAIARIEGFTEAGMAQTLQFVDTGDSHTPAGRSSVQDTLVSLRNLRLASGASIERVVLGGGGAVNATGNGAAQELIGNGAANRLKGKGGIDRLTGGDAGDTFVYTTLSDALIGGSSMLRSFEAITDFDSSQDRIDAPGTTQRNLTNLGSVGSLSDTDIFSLLTASNFMAGAAALFRFSPCSGSERLFLGINDANAGFNPLCDAIVELTGLKGAESAIMVS